VTAQTCEKFPKLVHQILRGGHEVGCHGYEHERYDKLDPDEQSKKVELATKVIAKITGQKPMGFRAPNFKPTPHVFAAVEHAGYVYDASVASYKTDPGSSRFKFVEIPNTLPSSVLRLPICLSTKILRLCTATLPLAVLDYHLWEVVEMPREIRFDCRFATGETALHRLDRALAYLLKKKANFTLMREVAEKYVKKSKLPKRG
jgi:peptidoglycan/xylan/chitin deacetylase (PgdA/CDA1 family)